MGWKFVFDGETYRDDDITLDQAERIHDLTGSNWFQAAPLQDAKHARIIVALIVSDATGKPYEGVESRMRAMRVNDVFEMFQKAEDDLPSEFRDGIPPVAAEPSTPT